MSAASDWIFTVFHICLLLSVIGYAFYSLLQGNIPRFAVIIVLLTGYYFIVLHKNVKKEIEQKRKSGKN